MFPDLSFWFHIPPSELAVTPQYLLYRYIKRLAALRKQMMQMQALAASIPWMDAQGQRSAWASMEGDEERGGLTLGREEMMSIAAGFGFAVEET